MNLISNNHYFWLDGKIVEQVVSNFGDAPPFCHCVDMDNKTPRHRYGQYSQNSWIHIPYEDLDPQFKLNLLLLGVT